MTPNLRAGLGATPGRAGRAGAPLTIPLPLPSLSPFVGCAPDPEVVALLFTPTGPWVGSRPLLAPLDFWSWDRQIPGFLVSSQQHPGVAEETRACQGRTHERAWALHKGFHLGLPEQWPLGSSWSGHYCPSLLPPPRRFSEQLQLCPHRSPMSPGGGQVRPQIDLRRALGLFPPALKQDCRCQKDQRLSPRFLSLEQKFLRRNPQCVVLILLAGENYMQVLRGCHPAYS